jgi:hypothetical protein
LSFGLIGLGFIGLEQGQQLFDFGVIASPVIGHILSDAASMQIQAFEQSP